MSETTQKQFEEKIKVYFPSAEVEVLEYSGTRKYGSVKCKKCQKVWRFQEARNLFNRVNFCCTKDFKNCNDKLKYFSSIYNFTILSIDEEKHKVTIQCNVCKKISQKTIAALKQFPNACECESYPVLLLGELQARIDSSFPKQYLILESNGANGKCLIKHLNCGFIFKVKCFSDLLNKRNRGCPKCYQFKSQGEKSIRDFLEEHKISYIPQKTFAPLNKSKYRFDFYLPDYNLAIEYQGEQHYRDNGYFKDRLDIIQKRDSVKREYCKKEGIGLLEISYKDFKKIAQIITSRLNDYPLWSKDKRPEKDRAISEDIV